MGNFYQQWAAFIGRNAEAHATKMTAWIQADGYDSAVEQCESEIAELVLKNQARLKELALEQGQAVAESYAGQMVGRHLMNLNSDLQSPVSGLGGVVRSADSEETQRLKKAAAFGISMNVDTDEEGEFAFDIEDVEGGCPEAAAIAAEVAKAAGMFAPIFSGQATTLEEWATIHPEMGNVNLRHIEACKIERPLSDALGVPESKVRQVLQFYCYTWRGARGEYSPEISSGKPEDYEAESLEYIQAMPEGSALRAIAERKPLEAIPGFTLGHFEAFKRSLKKEINSILGDGIEAQELTLELLNRSLSYVKYLGGDLSYDEVQKRKQTDLFDF